ncbi:aminodeoxychorismate/anthranilate synthase component II [Legionella sp. W05-934-2]|jgi:anthranilate synthase component 2|uniref:anthranilate synthase component II n=1 Tax=Legionella sp. W05-934-2 TaxID=1198649 RepID=UPI0034624636
MIVVIDNYDSFTYNLIHYLEILDQSIVTFQHDEVTLTDIESLNPKAILLSPGPNTPDEAGISLACIHHFYQRKPIIGVCLGLQCLVQAFGGRIKPANAIYHGKTSTIEHDGTGIFRHLPKQFRVARYHSLAADENHLPDCFKIQARSIEDNCIMAITHRTLPLFGLQFHPEAILTEYGFELLEQFIHDINEITV